MKIAIIDTLGLEYNGSTLEHKGLGGSESAVILISKELQRLGHCVTVFNNCDNPGFYAGVEYIDHKQEIPNERYDIVISSRSVFPYFAGNKYSWICSNARKKILWMHDTFCEGDQHIEHMLTTGAIDEVFTLSDFHLNYVTNANHGNKRMFEVLKHKFWQTRNGAVKHRESNISKKDRSHFVYNASATKGLIPLVTKVWPKIKKEIPEAHLTCVGGYYEMKDGKLDKQGQTVKALMEDKALKDQGITFTGIIKQNEIADILSNAGFMLYPTSFPETFGISTLESLLYNTPVITNDFGALEETAIDGASYKIPYPTTPNEQFPHINEKEQAENIAALAINAYKDSYLWQQKANYCDVVSAIFEWKSVALQWDQHFHTLFEIPYPLEKYRKVSRINNKVSRIFGRRFNNIEDRRKYESFGPQRRIVVISPFYNSTSYLKNHILSVATQDYNNYIHVLIDDCSTDGGLENTLAEIPDKIKQNLVIRKNKKNVGAIRNQIDVINDFVKHDDIVMLLDGDDWLIPNNTIFHYYNDLYDQGYDFSYGSMYSLADNIPLIAQDYPTAVKQEGSYRQHKFNWGIPYTHLRTFSGEIALDLDEEVFKDENGEWMMAGADNPLFYETIQKAHNPIAVKEVVAVYNDKNPLNDYKVRPQEQNHNANLVRYT